MSPFSKMEVRRPWVAIISLPKLLFGRLLLGNVELRISVPLLEASARGARRPNRWPVSMTRHSGASVQRAWPERRSPSCGSGGAVDEFFSIISVELSNVRRVNVRDAARSVFQVLNRYVQVTKVLEALLAAFGR
jgi:hypothetical protein